MGQPRPAILSVVTVPTGGWVLDIDISVGGSFDTNVEATIAAGDYFMGPIDSESFLHEMATKLGAAIEAADSGTPTDPVSAYIDDNHKVNIKFHGERFIDASGDNNVRINWAAEDGPSIAAVLGFDASAADSSTSTDEPTFTGDYHHAYGWYADEDGLLAGYQAEDIPTWIGAQVRAISGVGRTHHHGTHYDNAINLAFVPREKMLSGAVDYGDEPIYPYERNKPLQCWWNEAMQGKRFRFYHDYRRDTASAIFHEAQASSSSSTTLLVSGGNMDEDLEPDRFAGRILRVDSWNGHTQYWTIDGLTASDRFEVGTAATPATQFDGLEAWVFNQPYRVYEVDLEKMGRFAWRELPSIDRYDIDIPIRKYVSGS